jgi:phage gp29-like protein
MRTRIESVVSTVYTFDGGAKRLHRLLWEELEPNMEEIVRGVLDAVFYGYSVMEVIYKIRDDGKVGLGRVAIKPMEWFEPRPDGTLRYFPVNWFGQPGVPATASAYGLECDLDYKFLLTRVHPTYYNPKGEALLSRLYWPWFYRFNGWRFWGQFLERFAIPILVGQSADPRAMATALVNAHQDAVIGVGPNDNVTAIVAKDEGKAFIALEDAILRRIQKVILGQTLTSDTAPGGGGSYALGAVHNKVREDLMRSDIRLVRHTTQHLVRALCVLNGCPVEQVPDVLFNDQKELQRERAERDVRLAGIGVRFRKEYYQNYYGLSETEFDVDPMMMDENITRMGTDSLDATSSRINGQVTGAQNENRSVSSTEGRPRTDNYAGEETT